MGRYGDTNALSVVVLANFLSVLKLAKEAASLSLTVGKSFSVCLGFSLCTEFERVPHILKTT